MRSPHQNPLASIRHLAVVTIAFASASGAIAQSYKWLLDQGIRQGHALIGDSAGGALAVTTILRARQQGFPLPGIISICIAFASLCIAIAALITRH